MLESIPEVYPDAKYQRYMVQFYLNIFSATLRNKMKEVSMLLKAIRAQECKASAKGKAERVADKLCKMKLTSAAKKVEDVSKRHLHTWIFIANTGLGFPLTTRSRDLIGKAYVEPGQ